MKKTTLTLTTLGLLTVLSCGLVIHFSCKHENCSSCQQLSNDELTFITYLSGEKVIFKNDAANIFDTLTCTGKSISPTGCSSPCDGPNGTVDAFFSFSHLFDNFDIDVLSHNQPPDITFEGKNNYNFRLNVPTQSITINSTTYNDVYSVQVDSTTIATGDKQRVPWKIYYSKSQGFVRFYMVNGQTWSKQ